MMSGRAVVPEYPGPCSALAALLSLRPPLLSLAGGSILPQPQSPGTHQRHFTWHLAWLQDLTWPEDNTPHLVRSLPVTWCGK